jgi:hypothetical protein
MIQQDPYTRLADFLSRKLHTPLQWGTNDCCLFAADWALELTGKDLMADFRGRYATPLEACRLWRAVGGYAEEGARRLEAAGWKPCPPFMAPRGSIALFPTHKHHAGFGVVECGRVAVFTEHGVTLVPINSETQTWRMN